nr:xylulose kinase-1 [Tanacetum cinerariifolium]
MIFFKFHLRKTLDKIVFHKVIDCGEAVKIYLEWDPTSGSDNESDDASVHNKTTNTQQQPNIQPQIITNVSNNNAKFPYLKKDEYETGRGHDGRVIILPPTTAEEHIAVQRESKARTTLLQSIPDDHVADFHYMDDARDIWNAVKAKFGGNPESKKIRKSMLKQEFAEFRIVKARFGGNPESKKIRKSMLKQEFAEFRIGEAEGLHKGATSASKKMSHRDSPNYSLTTTYSVPSNSKTGSHRSGNKYRRKIEFDKKESARFNKKKVRCYKCKQRGHFARTCREKGGNNKQRYSSFKIKEIGKKEEDSKALITIDTLVDWTDYDSESDGVIAAKEFGIIAGCDSKNAIEEGAAKIYNLITEANKEEASTAGDAGEFALMGVTSGIIAGCDSKNAIEEGAAKIYNLITEANTEEASTAENTSNLLKHSERINADVETAKKDLQTKLDNHLVQTENWRTSSKNLFRLIDSSMSVRTKVGLGFNNYIRENVLGWDGSAFNVFTTNSEDVEGRPLFHRFAKADSMKVVPPPLSGDYTSLSDHNDLDESQMSYGTKSLTSSDSKSMSNDF